MNQNSNKAISRKTLKTIIYGFLFVVIVFLLTFGFKAYIIGNYKVQQSSMFPTLKEGDVVWVNKLDKPNYGDIVVIRTDEVNTDGTAKNLIKRAIAFEGDKLWVEQSEKSVNLYYLCRQKADSDDVERFVTEYYGNTTVPEMKLDSYAGLIKSDDGQNAIGIDKAFVVPENGIYLMGDNRNSSIDSRDSGYGAFQIDNVIGVVFGSGMTVIWWVLGISISIILLLCVLIWLRDRKNKKSDSETSTENAD